MSAYTPEPSCINPVLIKALEYLRDRPDSSARSIANGIGESDDRLVYKLLSNGAFSGYCQSWRGGGGPWHWQICPDGLSLVGGG